MQLVCRKFYEEVVPEYMSHNDLFPKINMYNLLFENEITLILKQNTSNQHIFKKLTNPAKPFICPEWPGKEEYKDAMEGDWKQPTDKLERSRCPI